MKISSMARYGLRAAFILAGKDGVVSAKELEREIGVSRKYLERIMRLLSGAGIVAANRGASGGYYLAKKPEETTAGEIIRVLEDDLRIIECVNGDCISRCTSGLVWEKLYKGINEILDGITLADMLSEDKKNRSKSGKDAICKGSISSPS